MPQRPARPGGSSWPAPRPAEEESGDPADEFAPAPPPSGAAQHKDQWRRYGLAEGMRKQAESRSAGAPSSGKARAKAPAKAPAPPRTPEENQLVRRTLLQLLRDADTANKRVHKLERVVDIQAARMDELTRRLDRLERE